MRNTRKIGVFLSGILLISGFGMNLTAKALDNGIYTAKCTPYYVHPVTGTVENRGGIDSVGIGQPMTDSATYPEALIEVDPDGNVFATVRLSLMDSIENVAFKVQADGNSPFYDVSYDVMQENLDANTTDFRMQIPNENSYLRANFYVVPMSRDVIYYIGFSDFQSGSSDFITSVEVVQPTESPQEEPQNEPIEEIQETQVPEETQPETTVETEVQTTTAETQAVTEKVTTTVTETESQTETETSTVVTTTETEATVIYTENGDEPMPSVGGNADNPRNGVMIYDEKGNLMQLSDVIGGTSAEITPEPEQNNSNNGFGVGVLAGVGGAAVIGGIIFTVTRKKGSQ
ncbi:MAG: hypothetical protein IJJ69_10515 [Oscillospiraceae bacterium]|nr:hypothetical protein [Oscillospiraceae bacterium]